MLHYPQLTSGAITQYPVRRTTTNRTLINAMRDGASLKMADPDASEVRWELRYSGLSDTERTALENLFVTAAGRLHTFTFIDPAGNALRWSEDLSASVWRRDGAITATNDGENSEGDLIVRVRNAGQIIQGYEQTLTAPAGMHWCLSATVRSSNPALVRCAVSNGTGDVESIWTAVPDWTQVWCSGVLPGDSEQVTARFEFEAGATVDICAMQLQAQPMPGTYTRTRSANGIFAETRFDADLIQFRADGPDDHSVTILLRSRSGGQ